MRVLQLAAVLLRVVVLMVLLNAGRAGAATINYGPVAMVPDPAAEPAHIREAYWRTAQPPRPTPPTSAEAPPALDLLGTDSTSGTRHEVLINGLTGNHTYYMYVRSGGTNSAVVTFQTTPNLLVNAAWKPGTASPARPGELRNRTVGTAGGLPWTRRTPRTPIM